MSTEPVENDYQLELEHTKARLLFERADRPFREMAERHAAEKEALRQVHWEEMKPLEAQRVQAKHRLWTVRSKLGVCVQCGNKDYTTCGCGPAYGALNIKE